MVFLRAVVINTIIPYSFLLNAAFVFTLIVISILLFIVLFLYRHGRRQQRKTQLRTLFNDLIAEITVCESEEELQNTLQQFSGTHNRLLAKPFPRKILIREVVKTKDSLSGGAAQNLRWLYETLELDKDTLQRFLSKKWHRKACAIQHFAEMQQEKYLVKIYREINSKNTFIRTEAQIAVVKLTGFKGLRFLNIVSYPVSQWQQLSLISQLQEGDIEEEKIKPWLLSTNETVVEFALRLVQVYRCFDLHDDVLASLLHPAESVRLQALHALKEISNPSTTPALLQHFPVAGKQEQLLILDLLLTLETGNREVCFLTSLLKHQDEAIRYSAMYAIQQLSPAWSSHIVRRMKDHPSFTYIFSSLKREAV